MRGKLLCTEQVSPSGCQIDRDSLENVSTLVLNTLTFCQVARTRLRSLDGGDVRQCTVAGRLQGDAEQLRVNSKWMNPER